MTRALVHGAARCAMISVCLWLPALAAAADVGARDALSWLAAMNRALDELDYHGTFSYLHGDDLATLQVTHVRRNGVSRERLVHLNGRAREIVRDGDRLACLLPPGDEMIELSSSIPAGPFARAFMRGFDAVPESYTLELGERGRIAAREAVQLLIRPNDEWRYGYRLWLDVDTALMLRSDLLDRDGRPLEIFQCISMIVGDGVPDVDMHLAHGPDAVLHMVTMTDVDRSESRPSSDVTWNATWLPAGFMMAAWDIRRAAKDAPLLNSVMYTDGLASFTVFIERFDDAAGARAEQTVRNGATVAVSHIRRDRSGDAHLVTVVGEVPVTTARRIAESVRPI